MEIDGRQRKTCKFVEEAQNGYGGSWFGHEFTRLMTILQQVYRVRSNKYLRMNIELTRNISKSQV